MSTTTHDSSSAVLNCGSASEEILQVGDAWLTRQVFRQAFDVVDRFFNGLSRFALQLPNVRVLADTSIDTHGSRVLHVTTAPILATRFSREEPCNKRP